MSVMLCKWLLLGDSLAVGIGARLPDAHVAAKVGLNHQQALTTLSKDYSQCPNNFVFVSLGSNSLYKDENIILRGIIKYLNKLNHHPRSKVIVLGIPALGKYERKAARVNYWLKKIANRDGYTYFDPNVIPLEYRAKDNIHLNSKGYKFVAQVLEFWYDKYR